MRHENGFTLVELMVITAISGFLVIAASSMMVTFSKFKYMADVQEQLKTEATFAASQIDLIIRNSAGIPDLCMTSFIQDPNEKVFCDGRPKYITDVDNQVSELTNDGFGTDATLIKCARPNNPLGLTNLNTNKASDNAFCCDKGWTPTSTTACKNSCFQGPYREQNDCLNSSLTAEERKDYIVAQAQESTPTYLNGDTRRKSLSHIFYNSNEKHKNPPSTTRLYNQIISLEITNSIPSGNESEGEYIDQRKIALTQYQIKDKTEAKTMLCQDIPRMVKENIKPDPLPLNYKKVYLTSDSVNVTRLSFDCKLSNYSLANQAAEITFSLELKKRKRSLTPNLYNDLSSNSSFDSFSITRTVNVRNSSHPFVFDPSVVRDTSN